MDENAIVEVLKSGLNLASTSISAIVGAVITTLFLRKNRAFPRKCGLNSLRSAG